MHGSGFAVLLNRPGKTSGDPFGYENAGFHVTFRDLAIEEADFHFYQTVTGYDITSGAEWRPDGRNVNPATMTGGEPRTALLSSFDGLNPNGDWTLFLADLSYGDENTLMGWSLNVETVPEPTAWAPGIFGVLAGGTCLVQRWRLRRGSDT